MRDLEAKDFLVQQTAEQAALENLPLSDLEKRMMYFTEVDECPEDPIALNDAFEAEYDTTEYEKKISGLMARAHSRIKKENAEKLRLWTMRSALSARAIITSSCSGNKRGSGDLRDFGQHMFLFSLSLVYTRTHPSSSSATGVV